MTKDETTTNKKKRKARPIHNANKKTNYSEINSSADSHSDVDENQQQQHNHNTQQQINHDDANKSNSPLPINIFTDSQAINKSTITTELYKHSDKGPY